MISTTCLHELSRYSGDLLFAIYQPITYAVMLITQALSSRPRLLRWRELPALGLHLEIQHVHHLTHGHPNEQVGNANLDFIRAVAVCLVSCRGDFHAGELLPNPADELFLYGVFYFLQNGISSSMSAETFLVGGTHV